jgi:hypothetical protein
LGIGGGIITRKLLFAVLLVSGLSLAGITGASATDVGTAQTQTDNISSVQEKVNTHADNVYNKYRSAKMQKNAFNNLKTNQKADNTSKTITEATENITEPKSSDQRHSTETANKNQSTVNTTTKSATNDQTQPVETASTDETQTTVETVVDDTQSVLSVTIEDCDKPEAFENQSMQNSVLLPQNSLNFEGFSMPANQSLQAAAGETKTPTSFTIDQINDAASRVKAYIETNHKLPNYVTIGTTQVQMPDFLKLLTAGLLQINNGSTTQVALETVGIPAKPSESIASGSITKANYLDLAKRVNVFIDANGVLPNYATSTLGKLRYESMIYMFSKVLDFQNTNSRLPSYVTVNAWSTISKTVLTQARAVYITSDNINGVTTDTNRINAIVKALKAMGLTAVNCGLGPSTHINVLKDSKVPANALVVDIYGGACAGTIYEMGQSYYKKLVGSRKVFSVWMPPATDITGLAWLPRSHDDNFDPASFTGLVHPDQYLLNNGYDYIYSGNLDAIIAAIYEEATTA